MSRHSYSSNISSFSGICRSHTNEAKQHHSDPEYIPTWKQSGHRSHNTDFKRVHPDCTITCSPIGGERIITASGETLANLLKNSMLRVLLHFVKHITKLCIEKYINFINVQDVVQNPRLERVLTHDIASI